MKKILKYEAKQLLRDKKTIFFVFILPLIIFPLINGLLSKAVTTQVDRIAVEKFEIAVLGNEFLRDVFAKAVEDSVITPKFYAAEQNTDSLLSVYPAVVSSQYSDSLKLDVITVTYSAKKDRQSIQAGGVFRLLGNVRRIIAEERYAEIGVENYFEESVPVLKNTATDEDVANSRTAGFLPVTLIVILLIGTFTISNYVILGEKDNNTLESLLSSGIGRRDIIYGKMAIVIMAGVIMSVLSLFSFMIYGRMTGAVSTGLSLGVSGMAEFIFLVITLSLLISSVTVQVSCRLKSSSSGQLAFLPLMLLFLVLGLMGTFEGVSITKGFLLLPVINSSGMLKAVITGKSYVPFTAFIVLLNIFYSFLVVKNASDYLSGEDILEKNSELDFVKKGFSKGSAMTIYALLVVSYMMIGGYLQGRNIVTGLIMSQVLILGGFTIFMKRMSGISYRSLLNLSESKPVFYAAALILGLFARYPVSVISEQLSKIFPVPVVLGQSDILSTALGDISIYYAVMIIAVLPAVFEEAVFRGVFFRILEKKYSKAGLVIVTGLMFGGIHLNVFTFFETSILGILLGLLVLRSGSVFPAVLMHFVNNAVSVILMKQVSAGSLDTESWFFTNRPFAYSMSAVCVFVLIYIIYGKSRKEISAS